MYQQNPANKNSSNDLLTAYFGSWLISYFKKYFSFIMNPKVEEIENSLYEKIKDTFGFFLISISLSVIITKLYIWIFNPNTYVPMILDIINPFYGSILIIYSVFLYVGIFISSLLLFTWRFKKSLAVDLTIHIIKLYALILPFFILAIQLWFASMLSSKLNHPLFTFFLALSLLSLSVYVMIIKVGQYLKIKYASQKVYLKTSLALLFVWIIGSQLHSIYIENVINKRAFFEVAKTLFDEKVYNKEITKEVAENKLIEFRNKLNIL